MAGDDADPAVPGYDPDISAELYTTNGDTDTHMTVRYGTLGFTPEMTTCSTVSESIPTTSGMPEDCVSGFIFPDDEELIQAEFAKNIPFALAAGRSALDPDDPVSVVGESTPDFVVDAFDVSYGTAAAGGHDRPACPARRADELHRQRRASPDRQRARMAGRRAVRQHPRRLLRRAARHRRPARRPATRSRSGSPAASAAPGIVASEHFTYTVSNDIGGNVLILAAEDVTGISPAQARSHERQVRRRDGRLAHRGRSDQ